ncbi:RidA family protein [Photobacterium phosphoreum]|uniref:RidA family protein n=1 Tax=Photobacterium phosphoreum TaxID=659 RepID=UPI001E42873F|nr:Rid family detoxifying hydrolase [Photobacterium phosphoreum]MCD9473073.1 reactive intermediate/imine deaminase [Photobacterium phosphoreum]
MHAVTSPDVSEAIGPYSHAMKSNGFLFTAGQMPVDADGKISETTIEGQTRQIFRNLRALLASEGLTTSSVVKSTVFVQELNEYPKLNAVYAEEFEGHKPARTTVQVAALPLGAKVEIEFVVEL